MLGSCAGPEEKAQKLFVETSHLVSLAQEAEQTSCGEALMLYQRALAKAEEITTRYATSLLAGKLRVGEAKIGPYTLTELRDVVVPRAEMKAQAESDPLACALLVANTIPNSSRASAVADIAVAYDEAGRYDQILRLVKTTRDSESNSWMVSALTSRYLQAGQYDQALGVANVIEDAARKEWALDWIRREAVARGHYNRAFAIVALLRSKAGLLVSIASAYAQEGKREQVAKVLLQALEATHTLEDPFKERMLREIAHEYAAVGLYERALEVTALIAESLLKADVLAAIVSRQAEAGHYDAALQLADTIEDGFAKYKAFLSIADRLAHAGHKARAADVLRSALAVSHTVDVARLRARRMSFSPRPYETIAPGLVDSFQVEATAEIAGRYVALGQLDRALQLAHTVGDVQAERHVLTTMARRYIEGVPDEQAQRIVEAIADPRFREHVAEAVTHRAAEREQQMWEQEARQQDPDEQAKRLINAVRQYAEAGQYDHALAVARARPESFYQTQALVVIADRYIAEGQYDRALTLTPTMENAPKAGILLTLAFRYTATSAPDKASTVLSQVLQIAQASKGVYAKADVLKTITEVLAAVGVSSAQRGQPVESGTKKVLHMIVSELGDSVTGQDQPPSSERTPRGYDYLFGADLLE